MGIWDQVVDFVTRLVKGRIDGASITAQSKLKNIEVQAKSAVSKRFNEAIDGTVDKAKAKAQAKAQSARPEASSTSSQPTDGSDTQT